jgi:hypothetical protein
VTIGSGAVLRTNPQYRAVTRQLESLQERRADARRAALCELDRTCGSRGGPQSAAYRAKHRLELSVEDALRSKQKQIRSLRTDLLRAEAANKRVRDRRTRREIKRVNALLKAQRAKRSTEEGEEFDASQSAIGLLDRVDALGRLTDANASMRYVARLLTLFILLVDIVPIMFKTLTLIGRPTLYEQLQDASDGRSLERVLREDELRSIAHEIDSANIVATAKNRQKYAGGVIDALNQLLARTQQEVGESAIRKWGAAAGASEPPPVEHERARGNERGRGWGHVVAQWRRIRRHA